MTIKLPKLPFSISDYKRPDGRSRPPGLGEHSTLILRSAGFSKGEISALVSSGTVQASSRESKGLS